MIGSISSRCPGKWAHGHPLEPTAGLVSWTLSALANENTARRISSGIIITKLMTITSDAFRENFQIPGEGESVI